MLAKLSRALWGLLKNEDGPTAVEYSIMIALIIVVCVATLTFTGTKSKNRYTQVGTKVVKTGR